MQVWIMTSPTLVEISFVSMDLNVGMYPAEEITPLEALISKPFTITDVAVNVAYNDMPVRFSSDRDVLVSF
jgi:hypothetical protein